MMPRPETIAFVEHVLIHVFKQRAHRKQVASVAAKIERTFAAPSRTPTDVPFSKGGATAEPNLRACCWKCNNRKGAA